MLRRQPVGAVALVTLRLALGSVAIAAVLAGLALLLDSPALAQSGRRVIDRTLVCTTGLQGGIREIDLVAQAGVKSTSRPTRWATLAGFELTTAGTAEPGPEQWFLAAISAGRHETFGGGTVSIGPGRCKATSARVPFSPTGLRRQPAGQLGDQYDCAVPAKILVRARASFRAPAALGRNRWGYLTATGAIATEGKLAVRTLSGKPLVYAEAFEDGRARLFTGRGCLPT